MTSILAWARSSGRSRVGYATLAVTGALLCSSPLSGAPTLEVRNIATDWLTFWDATRGQPTPERVAVFKRDVASKFPAFYAASRFSDAGDPAKQDARIAREIDRFAPIRDAYAAKVAGFAAASARNNASFLRAFPDFRPAAPVWLLHGLGEMDGGTRELDGTSPFPSPRTWSGVQLLLKFN